MLKEDNISVPWDEARYRALLRKQGMSEPEIDEAFALVDPQIPSSPFLPEAVDVLDIIYGGLDDRFVK